MNKANRAAQFAPFDALKGLNEALRKKEEKLSRVEKIELSEEMSEELSHKLIKLEKGQRIKITFYCYGRYITTHGIVTQKNQAYKFLTLNDQKIYFDDIYDLRLDL
ncbi:MAG: YolD-like family protein [Bacillota bacterium]|nr:YolD-like family protein [Bacillota bacterium]HHU43441.1 YolD-like family protein [Clostridiales bacterium]